MKPDITEGKMAVQTCGKSCRQEQP